MLFKLENLGVSLTEILIAPRSGYQSEQVVTIEADLVELALHAIDKIMTDSELKDLWEEDEGPPLEWWAVVENLRIRLKQ